jgi:hypothetical protein
MYIYISYRNYTVLLTPLASVAGVAAGMVALSAAVRAGGG